MSWTDLYLEEIGKNAQRQIDRMILGAFLDANRQDILDAATKIAIDELKKKMTPPFLFNGVASPGRIETVRSRECPCGIYRADCEYHK